MSRLGVLRGRREHPQRPSPASEHRGLRRAHLPHALVTRTPTTRQRAGTRRLGERGRSPRPHPGCPPVGELLRYGIHTLLSLPRREPLRSRAGPGGPAPGTVRDLGRRASPRGDDRRRGADVAPDLVHRVFHAERPHARRVSDRTSVDTTEGMADVSLLDATSRMIVGGQVASEMTVQTVLRALEVARLRRGAFHGGLSFSLDRAHSDAWSQYRRPRGHAPGRDRRGSLRRATGRATTPHAGEPERLL